MKYKEAWETTKEIIKGQIEKGSHDTIVSTLKSTLQLMEDVEKAYRRHAK